MAHAVAIGVNRFRVPSHHSRETQKGHPDRRNSQENRHQSAIADSIVQQKMVRRMRQNARQILTEGSFGLLSTVLAINGTKAWASRRYSRKQNQVLHNCHLNKRLRREFTLGAKVQLSERVPNPTIRMIHSSAVLRFCGKHRDLSASFAASFGLLDCWAA